MRAFSANPLGKQARYVGRGQRKKPGQMTKTEEAFVGWLESNKRDGHAYTYCWFYECAKWRLADGAWYVTDFMVANGIDIKFYEVKPLGKNGRPYIQPAARLKLKMAAELYRDVGAWILAWPADRKFSGWKFESY